MNVSVRVSVFFLIVVKKLSVFSKTGRSGYFIRKRGKEAKNYKLFMFRLAFICGYK